MAPSREDKLDLLSIALFVETAQLAAACSAWVAENPKDKLAHELLDCTGALITISVEDTVSDLVDQVKHIRSMALAHPKRIILTIGTAANRLLKTAEDFSALYDSNSEG